MTAARQFAVDIACEAYDLAEWAFSDHAAALAVITGLRREAVATWPDT